MDTVVFFVCAAAVVVGALGVIAGRNPVHSALFLLLTLVSIAVLYLQQHAALEWHIVRFAKRPPQHERRRHRAWRASLFNLREDQCDHRCRQAPFLQHMRHRAHGAGAQRSNGAQNNGVDAIGMQRRGDASR